jgi:hypothetical protein
MAHGGLKRLPRHDKHFPSYQFQEKKNGSLIQQKGTKYETYNGQYSL